MDVTDATFETAVLERSTEVPVVVDLWAEWCGPCRTLGPIIEKVVGETGGRVELVKVDVDANPRVAATFQVRSIPAVYAIADRKVVDSFVGALPEPQVREWVNRLAPEPTEVDTLISAGDEASLRRAVELEPANEKALLALAGLLVDADTSDSKEEALGLLARLPETAEVRHLIAKARVGDEVVDAGAGEGVDAKLDGLLERVKSDEAARQEFLDLLEVLGPDDPRTAGYRKALTARLF
ncbi:tetratricopeptide repeat protein [Acidiferrimicrobium sp. IK]|uniref:tetratricopeptide repeat protein n=1 Tax=Acidiferrimicrobium sp. IK TaxID=2871700 RepID=UPI0021CAE886|nr:tetratricopeptide repeat protein [Acidiferrimicrobium sp. IK]MCU4187330.1 tetratricopeptide repeat protein [Acidiferrimicrobium sp. IK]